jgi:hypothetical protein
MKRMVLFLIQHFQSLLVSIDVMASVFRVHFVHLILHCFVSQPDRNLATIGGIKVAFV